VPVVAAVADAIDVHGHCIPQAFLDEVLTSRAFGVDVEAADGRYLLTFPGRPTLRPIAGAMLDRADRRPWLAEQAVRHQVVAPWLDIHGQELPPADGPAWVRLLNDAMAASVADPALPLSAHAVLYLGSAPHAAEELHRAVTQLGMRSAMIPTNLPSGRLSDPAFDELWSAAQSLGVPIVLHPPTEAPSNDLVAHYPDLRGLFNRQVDSTLVAAELILAGVLDRFPALRLVVVHGGGFLPYQAARFARDAKGREGAGSPEEAVRALYYDTVLMSPAALRFLVDAVGADHILVGSDYGAGAKFRADVNVTEPIRSATPDPGVRAAVLAGNARAVFGVG
jgi:aminocarboxymuconate-semialdehyde decarboxylase